MADIARIRNLQRFTRGGTDEPEGMAAYINIGDRLRDLGHMARNAFTTGTVCLVMRVRFNGGSMGTVR